MTAFVILPFVERDAKHPRGFFLEVLRSLITPAAAAKECGFTVKTANRQGSDMIQSTIVNDLIEADLVIADLTDTTRTSCSSWASASPMRNQSS
ncbi:MAG TPA: hypothetical protein VMT20_10740 [Terriglobia bacterium]|nr:hypothetical protein [Terriglobia bacterium]